MSLFSHNCLIWNDVQIIWDLIHDCSLNTYGIRLLLIISSAPECSPFATALGIHDWTNQLLKGKHAPFVRCLEVLTISLFDEWLVEILNSACLTDVTCSARIMNVLSYTEKTVCNGFTLISALPGVRDFSFNYSCILAQKCWIIWPW